MLAKKWEAQFSTDETPLKAASFEFEGTRYVAAQTHTGTYVYREADLENWFDLLEDPEIRELICWEGRPAWDYLEPVQGLAPGYGKGLFIDTNSPPKGATA